MCYGRFQKSSGWRRPSSPITKPSTERLSFRSEGRGYTAVWPDHRGRRRLCEHDQRTLFRPFEDRPASDCRTGKTEWHPLRWHDRPFTCPPAQDGKSFQSGRRQLELFHRRDAEDAEKIFLGFGSGVLSAIAWVRQLTITEMWRAVTGSGVAKQDFRQVTSKWTLSRPCP